jgi:hypothetical protein
MVMVMVIVDGFLLEAMVVPLIASGGLFALRNASKAY